VRVLVDESHALGTVGPGGRGAVADAGLEDEVDVLTGSLGKALGAYGGYVCCDHVTARYLVNSARTLLHSTAPPPVAVAAAMAALELLAEQPRRVEKLQANAESLRDGLAREGFDVAGCSAHITPLVVGDAELAVRIVDAALEQGVFAEAVRPPAVPDGTARVRLTAMASHTRSELREAATVLARAALRCGFRPSEGVPVAAAQEPAARELPRAA
jgi:7-keto-8-aminopelargonate synthetase-like enzyme